MTPVRMTGPRRQRRWRTLFGAGCLVTVSACGGGTEPRVKNDKSPDLPPAAGGVTERSDRGQRLPAPDAAEIVYDEGDRTLRLYDPPAETRWMVQLPNERTAVPAGREYKLPDGPDPDRTLVYYARPGGQQSKVVSLRQIQRSREVPTSHVP